MQPPPRVSVALLTPLDRKEQEMMLGMSLCYQSRTIRLRIAPAQRSGISCLGKYVRLVCGVPGLRMGAKRIKPSILEGLLPTSHPVELSE